MVLKNKGRVGTALGLVSVVGLGIASIVNVNCNRGKDYVDNGAVERVESEISEVESYKNDRSKILDNLEKVAGGRLFDRTALFNSKLENKDLETFIEIYKNDKQFREDENWGNEYTEFNPNTELGIETLWKYEKSTPGLNLIPEGYLINPEHYIWGDVDKTAIVQYMIMNCDVDFGTITF